MTRHIDDRLRDVGDFLSTLAQTMENRASVMRDLASDIAVYADLVEGMRRGVDGGVGDEATGRLDLVRSREEILEQLWRIDTRDVIPDRR